MQTHVDNGATFQRYPLPESFGPSECAECGEGIAVGEVFIGTGKHLCGACYVATLDALEKPFCGCDSPAECRIQGCDSTRFQTACGD